MLAKVCSAFWQHKAFSIESIFTEASDMCETRDSKNVKTATSSEAELDKPPPSGTDVTMTASNGGSNSTIKHDLYIMNEIRIALVK